MLSCIWTLAHRPEYTILSSRKLHFAMVFEVDASSPARSRRDPGTIAFPGLDPTSGLRSIAPLSINLSGSAMPANAHLTVLASDGSLHSFGLLSASMHEAVSPEPTSSEIAPIRPVWSEEMNYMAADQRALADRQRDWQDKAATKHKVLDLLWVWKGRSPFPLNPMDSESALIL